jgi:glycine/sarcosine N-methyltransferase
VSRDEPDPRDPYSRLQYRRLVAWPRRIEREWPFLSSLLERAPERSVIDLGCGTGEHALHLASRGYRAVGLDRSQAQIEEARRAVGEGDNPRFLVGDLTRVASLAPGPFGAALCLGNTLVHLTNEADLERALEGTRRVLLPGGPWILQILNYRKIRRLGTRHLPVNVRPAEGRGELVFLRLMKLDEKGEVLFLPTTLHLDPERDPPVEVVSSRSVRLRGWTDAEILARLERAGFEEVALYGGMQGEPFEPEGSDDLVVVARA